METDKETAKMLEILVHEDTTLRVVAERQFMKKLNGGCSSPVAIESTLEKGVLTVKGGVFSLDGKEALYETKSVNLNQLTSDLFKDDDLPTDFTGIIPGKICSSKMLAALKLGNTLAVALIINGAEKILDEARAQNVTPENTPSVPPTKLTRPNTPPLETQNETVEAKKTESPSRCPLGAKAKEITKSLLG
jgi:hypothetical protein